MRALRRVWVGGQGLVLDGWRQSYAAPTPNPDTRPGESRGQAGGEYQRNKSPSRWREGLGVGAEPLT